MALLNFNANEYEEQSFELIPAGWYQGVVVMSDLGTTKDGSGVYVKLQVRLQGNPAYNDRVVFDQINIKNSNPVAEKIGNEHLATLCRAVGVMNLSDTTQLHGIPMMVKIGVRMASDSDKERGYDDKNIIKGFKKLDGVGAPVMSAPVATVSRPAAPAAAPKPVSAPVAAPAAPRRGRPPKAQEEAEPKKSPIKDVNPEDVLPENPVVVDTPQPVEVPDDLPASILEATEGTPENENVNDDEDTPSWMQQ